MQRPAPFVPVGVNIATGKTGTAILKKFGAEGIATWVCFLAACKRSRVQGQISYASDAEAWETLGLAKHRPEFDLDDFFTLTGHLKQTRRTRSGRTTYVISTRWEDWNNAAQREGARQRKARSRRETTRDTTVTGGVTQMGQGRDSRAQACAQEGEIEKNKSSSRREDTTRTAAEGNGLPITHELEITKLITWSHGGTDHDERTPAIIRSKAEGLSEAALARVTESVECKPAIRKRAHYVVGALNHERDAGSETTP